MPNNISTWNDIKIWIEPKLHITVPINKQTILLGYFYKDKNYLPINLLLLTVKYNIFVSGYKKKIPNPLMMQAKLKYVFS